MLVLELQITITIMSFRGCADMTKKEKLIDELRDIVLDRYESIGVVLTPHLANTIWYDLLGEYDRNGYDSAKARALNGKLQ